MRLTSVDRMILDSYSHMLSGLSEYLGPGYEIILHSLEDYDKSVIKIINGHYSGRSVGAPITDLALRMLRQIEKNDGKEYITYFNRNQKGTLLKCSTIAIRGENGRIIGLLCMNFYSDLPFDAVISSFLPKMGSGEDIGMSENLASDTKAVIREAIEKAKNTVLVDSTIQRQNRNKEIIRLLHEEGIFNLKDAVAEVSSSLGVSRNTVYSHLRGFLRE
ncbi:MAG: PAS domain-containing protein [Candidatus Ornithospirochaeta sp.]|nr:PAS domain-containing protein [Candidatus Ornithospirochaeta sp.]